MLDNSGSAEKSISDTSLAELWNQLSRNQQRFAVAMLECSTKKEGALAIGLEPDTVYRWPAMVDVVIERLMNSAASSAYEILKGSVVKAANIKREGLESQDEKLRQDVSTEVLDRILGRATQKHDVTSGGEKLEGYDPYTDVVARVQKDLASSDGEGTEENT